MSRDIKFRAWDKESGHMIYAFYIEASGYRLMEDNTAGWPFLDRGAHTLMQYTGRSDIDGHEVYEDDILRFPGSDQNYFVKWLDEEGGWGIMFSETTQMGKIGMSQFMQVVGNAYENSHLLTKER